MINDSQVLLGVDFGLAKVGLAVGSLVPVTPLEVLYYQQESQLLDRLVEVATREQVAGLVIGWPADHLTMTTPQTEKIRKLGETVRERTGLPVIYQPETLTTQMATKRMIEVGISKQRRRQVEDSYAAAAILDSYLEGLGQ
jgi:putative Holliday junction resolvase